MGDFIYIILLLLSVDVCMWGIPCGLVIYCEVIIVIDCGMWALMSGEHLIYIYMLLRLLTGACGLSVDVVMAYLLIRGYISYLYEFGYHL